MRLAHVLARARRDESGTAAIEFAATASFLLVILIGVTDVGRLSLASMRVRNAAEAGATYAANNGSDVTNDPQIIAAATAATTQGGTTSSRVFYGCASTTGITVVSSTTSTCLLATASVFAPGKYVSVTSQIDFEPCFQPAFVVYPHTVSHTLQVRVK